MTARGAVVLGGGVTGLAAGVSGGGRVYEAADGPGGICGSYHVTRDGVRHGRRPHEDAYRFEVGGGHWIFGGDDRTLAWIDELAPLRSYERRSAVDLGGDLGRIDFPLQHHLAQLGPALASQVLAEVRAAAADHRTGDGATTMSEWFRHRLGPTLCDLFFDPFHERYTANLADAIAPQDPDKSPLRLDAVVAGASGARPGGGYNQRFAYPVGGLDELVGAMAAQADVRFGHRVTGIDPARRELHFSDGSDAGYDDLVSTLPLHVALDLAGIDVAAPADPYTSVLVVNVAAEPGSRSGTDHWVYVPRADSGFHRYGTYSNVDASFLPAEVRPRAGRPAARVSLYIERAYPGGSRPDAPAEAAHVAAMVDELQRRDVIGEVEVVDPTWIDVAYTWSWPGSTWVDDAIAALERAGVRTVGRYGRWRFQGIAESIREGLAAGTRSQEEAGRR